MGCKIMIVDDSSTMRKIVMRAVRQAGFDVEGFLEAGDGKEGMNVLGSQSVRLILSDVNMPNMNGLEFVKAVRMNEATKSIPIVMITSEGSEDMVNQALGSGANGYIKKPFTPEKIKETLSDFLG
jgi:two-component system chemotaxis response regulator CheY